MKKRVLSIILAASMLMGLAACTAKAPETTAATAATQAQETKAAETQAAAAQPAATQAAETKAAETEKEPVYVGVLAPLTGAMAEYGKTFEVAMTMRQEEINAAGGINGRPLVLDFADSKGDQNQSAELAARFADDEKYVAILGDFASGCSMAAAPVCDEAEIVLLAPTASNSQFAAMSPWAYSVAGNSAVESKYDAQAIKKYANCNSVAVFYLNSDYGVTAYKSFESYAQQYDLDIVFEESYADGETDFSALITKARAVNPEMVAIIDQASTSNIINTIRGVGWDVPITMIGMSTNGQLIDLCGENCEGALCSATVNFDENDPVTGPFLKVFMERAGFFPTQMAGYAYDATQVLAEAMIRCGDDLTRDGIRQELMNTDKTFLTGPIKFTEIGEIERVFLIFQVEGGKYVLKCNYDYFD